MAEPFLNNESGKYYVSFSYRGRRYKRSTGTSELRAAKQAQTIIDGKVEQLKVALLQVPPGVSVSEFIFDNKSEWRCASERGPGRAAKRGPLWC